MREEGGEKNGEEEMRKERKETKERKERKFSKRTFVQTRRVSRSRTDWMYKKIIVNGSCGTVKIPAGAKLRRPAS